MSISFVARVGCLARAYALGMEEGTRRWRSIGEFHSGFDNLVSISTLTYPPLATHTRSRQTLTRHLLNHMLTHLSGGGHPPTTNRTLWPITGGAIALQPGWFQGHATAFMYINLGFGTDGPGGGPKNMSFPMVPVFQLVGPSKNPYPGTMCLPQVPLPANTTVKPGDNATIQVVETALHGAALYSVSSTFSVPLFAPRLEDIVSQSFDLRSQLSTPIPRLTSAPIVRRYYLRSPRRCSRSERNKLF